MTLPRAVISIIFQRFYEPLVFEDDIEAIGKGTPSSVL
jgi:hypothetical protein